MRTLWTLLLLLAALVAVLAWSLAPDVDSADGALASAPRTKSEAGLAAGLDVQVDVADAIARDALAPSAEFIAAEAQSERERRPKARITGRLLDADGAPLEGVRVLYALAERGPQAPLDWAVWDEPERKRGATESDSEGRFAVDNAPVGWVRVAFRALDHEPRDLDGILVAEGQEVALGDFELALGARLTGVVVDANGAPVADAWLIRPSDLMRPSLGRAPGDRGVVLGRSAANGAFDLRGLPPGPWTLLAHAPEFPDVAATGGGVLSRGDDPRLVLRFPPAATVRGRVLVESGPHAPSLDTLEIVAYPVEEEAQTRGEAALSRRQTRPSATGEFEIRGVTPEAAYRVRAVIVAPSQRGGELVFDGGVDARGGDEGLELRVAAIRSVSFVAVDAQSTEGVVNARAQLQARADAGARRSLEAVSKHGEDGRTSLVTDRALRPGERAGITVSAPGYLTFESEDFAFERGANVDLGRVELQPRPKLSVRVVDASTGRGVKNARVWMVQDTESSSIGGSERRSNSPATQRSEPTDADGRTTVHGGSFDCGQLTARVEGYASAPLTPACFSSAAAPIELLLSPGASLAVRVVGADGGAGASRLVMLQRDTSVELLLGEALRYFDWTRTTDADGLAQFTGVTPGAYRAALLEPRCGAPRSADEHSRTFGTAVLDAGTAVGLDLFALPRGTLSGRVTCARRPLAHATVSLNAPSSNYPRALGGRNDAVRALTDAEGRYRIDDLGPGAWNVTVAHPEFVASTRVALGYDGDERTFDIDIPRTALVGRIVDAAGNPLAGARLVIGRWQPGAASRDRRASPFQPLPNGGPLAPTGDDGSFAVLGAPVERLAIEIRHPDCQTLQTKPFVPTAGLEHPLGDIVLQRAGRIAVELERMAPDGPRPRVIARRLDGPKNESGEREVRSLSLDVRGKVLLRGLAPGKWRVELDPRIADRPRVRRELQVQAGKTEELVFASL